MQFDTFIGGRRRSPRPKSRALPDLREACLVALFTCFTLLLLGCERSADALDAIVIDPNKDRIDVTALGELYEGRGDRLQIDTVPGADGIVGRMAVQATTTGTNPNWIVFALKNATDKPIVRWLSAQRYTLVGSRVFWPDLDSGRVAAVTPSLGFRPERISDDRADIFLLTIEPGATITFHCRIEFASGAKAHALEAGGV